MMTELSNITNGSMPLHEHPLRWLFEDSQGKLPANEHLDQIFALDANASKALWDFEDQIKINNFDPESKKYFEDYEKFSFGEEMEKEVKKWLFNQKLKFNSLVYMTFQPDTAFVMTWKMAIHYSANLFSAYDLVVWDKTLNWALYYHHNDVFHFAQNRIYDGQEEKLKSDKLLKEINEQNPLLK
ncbi:MAG: hypothetical protein GQ574_07155 [Crocinitomix sp.]|nr:hypothetical protein [Crocinitomix sp.]